MRFTSSAQSALSGGGSLVRSLDRGSGPAENQEGREVDPPNVRGRDFESD